MRTTLRFAFVLALILGTTTFTPTATALPNNEITTTYYDACLFDLFTRVIDCSGIVWTSSGSSAGAVYKEIDSVGCDSGGTTITWYQNVGGTWVRLSGAPSPAPGC